MTAARTGRTRIDWHGHLYRCHDTAVWLAAAADRLCGNPADAVGVVVVYATSPAMDMPADQWMREAAAAGWMVGPSDEGAWHLVDGRGRSLCLLPGRQVVCAEGLEVLVLGGQVAAVEPGGPLLATIRGALDGGSRVTLPWGVGKWLGRRGRLVREAVGVFGAQLLLGDNANRPVGWRRPALLAGGAGGVCGVFPGSDPLPLAGHAGRVGVYGSGVAVGCDPQRVLADVRGMLDGPVGRWEVFGGRVSVVQAVRDQVRLRRRSGARG